MRGERDVPRIAHQKQPGWLPNKSRVDCGSCRTASSVWHLTVRGVTHALAPTESVGNIKAGALAAAQGGGGFHDATVDGGQRLSIYTTGASFITIAADTLARDTGSANGVEPDVERPLLRPRLDMGCDLT